MPVEPHNYEMPKTVLELHEAVTVVTPHGEFQVCVYDNETTLRTINGKRLVVCPQAANAVTISDTL